jgi:zinc protease
LRDAVADKPMTAAEIAGAKDRMVKQLAGRWETGASVAGALSEIETYGLPKDYYATYADVLRKASDAEVNAAAKRFVLPSQLVWVVIGDRAKIESGIKELKLGDIQILDADGHPKGMMP